jgi:hypothetical protein
MSCVVDLESRQRARRTKRRRNPGPRRRKTSTCPSHPRLGPVQNLTHDIPHRPFIDGDAELAKQGAYFVAIPATWFNGGWGETVCSQINLNATDTYFCAYLVGSSQTPTERLEFRIVLDNSGNSWMTHAAAEAYRSLWLLHGSRTTPIYCLSETHEDVIEDPTDLMQIQFPPTMSQWDREWNWGVLETTESIYENNDLHNILCVARDTLLTPSEPRLFPWTANNCHVDTWLVVQLAFYTYNEWNAAGTATDWPDAYRKLFRVLSTVGDEKTASVNRDFYLCYERQAAKNNTVSGQRRRWGDQEDYARHTSLLVRYAQREGTRQCKRTRADRLVGVIQTTPCSMCEEPARQHAVWYAVIPATRFWYPMRDMDAFKRGLLDAQKAYHNTHETLRDAILTHIHRDDYTQVSCQRHAGHPESVRAKAYTVKLKKGKQARLPRMIELDNGDMGVSYCVAGSIFTLANGLTERIDLGEGVSYRMVALTYYSGQHYGASVLLAGTWYMYNDLDRAPVRIPQPATHECSLRGMRRL